MNTFDEIIADKLLNAYNDTDPALIQAAEAYNRDVDNGALISKRQKNTQGAFFGMNLFVYLVIAVQPVSQLHLGKWAFLGASAFFLFTLLFFGWRKRMPIVHTAVSFLMPIFSGVAWVLCGFNVLATLLFMYNEQKAKHLQGYPKFERIAIFYRKGSTPEQHDSSVLREGVTEMLVIDRIEEDTVVLECSNASTGEVYMQNIPRSWIIGDVQEGMVLRKTAEGYAVNEAETRRRREIEQQRIMGLSDL